MARCPKCSAKFKLHNWTGTLPECPRCDGAVEDKLDLSKPVRIAQGGSPIAQAVKIAQEVAEKQYGLTDIRTGVDPGENHAPKLTPSQEVMDRAWKQAGTFTAPQRFPGLAAGQGWLDAARVATAATGHAAHDAISPIMRELKTRKLMVEDAATGRRRAMR